jgi:NodT family efflux transporter outer membrane factor (OMF) lipoprotein
MSMKMDLAPSRGPGQVAAAACLPLLLTACAVTRVEPPAPAAAPAQFKEVATQQNAAGAPGTEPLSAAWWPLFRDPVLDELQARLVIGNESLKAAVARVASARALLGASRAAQLPLVSAGVSATRSDSGSSNGSNSSFNSAPQTNLSISANASWELDLWGRLAEATRGSEASFRASEADLAAARLSAQATLVQTYFALRAAEAQRGLIDRSVKAYERSLELTQVRYQGGVAAASDVLQAQTQLKTAQVQGIEAEAQRAQLEHAIAVLLGQPPAALNLARATEQQELPEPPAVPELLPSTLLQRRPDIAAAERRVAAAYAQIGVADAAFFPNVSLGASGGTRARTVDALFSAPTLFWSLGPSLAQVLFDGGARRAASDQARANADLATATFRQTVLTAFQEVEDNLVLADRLQTQTALQREALKFAQRNLDITQEQYRVGTVSYLNVVTAQTTALTAERTLLDVRTRQLNAVNQLLKNVAGRW